MGTRVESRSKKSPPPLSHFPLLLTTAAGEMTAHLKAGLVETRPEYSITAAHAASLTPILSSINGEKVVLFFKTSLTAVYRLSEGRGNENYSAIEC